MMQTEPGLGAGSGELWSRKLASGLVLVMGWRQSLSTRCRHGTSWLGVRVTSLRWVTNPSWQCWMATAKSLMRAWCLWKQPRLHCCSHPTPSRKTIARPMTLRVTEFLGLNLAWTWPWALSPCHVHITWFPWRREGWKLTGLVMLTRVRWSSDLNNRWSPKEIMKEEVQFWRLESGFCLEEMPILFFPSFFLPNCNFYFFYNLFRPFMVRIELYKSGFTWTKTW